MSDILEILRKGAGPKDVDRAADEITSLRASNKILRLELIKQWWSNHSEHCGGGTYQKFPWPHEGDCYWPLPECLSDITPEEIAAAIRSGK